MVVTQSPVESVGAITAFKIVIARATGEAVITGVAIEIGMERGRGIDIIVA